MARPCVATRARGFDEVLIVAPSAPRAALREQHVLDLRPLLVAQLPANHATWSMLHTRWKGRAVSTASSARTRSGTGTGTGTGTERPSLFRVTP